MHGLALVFFVRVVFAVGDLICSERGNAAPKRVPPRSDESLLACCLNRKERHRHDEESQVARGAAVAASSSENSARSVIRSRRRGFRYFLRLFDRLRSIAFTTGEW